MSDKTTPERILNSAEILFSERGFSDTSLRMITTHADVNLAAVNYHFGSKKELIQAVFARFLDVFTIRLEARLGEYFDSLGTASPNLHALLTVFADSAITAGEGCSDRLNRFMKLLGLAYSQGQGHLRRFMREQYGEVFRKYMSALQRSAPQLTEQERFWRIHFMLGASIFTLSGIQSLAAMAEYDFGIETGVKDVLGHLVPFLTAGFQAGE